MSYTDLEAAFIARIQDNCPLVKTVGKALSMKDVPDLSNDVPAVFVLDGGFKADEVKTRPYRQRVYARVIVQVAAPENEILAVRNQLLDALGGFQVTPEHNSAFASEAEPIDVKPNLHWWAEIWNTSYQLTKS